MMMNRLLKYFGYVFLLGLIFDIHPAAAWTKDYNTEACGIVYEGNTKAQKSYEPLDTDGTKQLVDQVNATITKMKAFCDKLKQHIDNVAKTQKDVDKDVFPTQHFNWSWKQETASEYQTRFNQILEQYPAFKEEYEILENEYSGINSKLQTVRKAELNEHERAKKEGEYQPCGSKYPRGCPEGMECYAEGGVQIQGTAGAYKTTTVSYTCKKPEDVKKPILGDKPTPVQQGTDTSTINQTVAGINQQTVVTDETGKTRILEKERYKPDNSACDIAGMKKNYQSDCYSCRVILTLITVFMNACAKVYDLTREAGSKVLLIGSLFWLASFSLQKVSAFTSQEPMQILNEFFIFMFKVTAAYILLNAGVPIIVNLIVNPLLVAGADYGIGLMKAANAGLIDIATTTNYAYTGTEVLPAQSINKLMALTQGIDKTVATNLVVGHALTCHAVNAGLITLVDSEILGFQVTFRIPDVWIWICGAAIWFCGFMLTLGVGYYLLDTSYKIGFCIIALPIVIGLWPFGKTRDRFNKCMSIIFRAAALFTFLALTVSYALSLISGALGDVGTLYAKVEAGDTEWISNTFSITGPRFTIIVFAYIYSIKLVGATVESLLSKFFNDDVFGNEGEGTSMHYKATQMTDFAKKKVTDVASGAVGKVANKTANAVGSAAGKTVRAVGSMAKGAINMAKKKKSSGSDE